MGETTLVHLSLHLLGLFVVQFKSQSSHFSFHSFIQFQHIALVLLHSKEHFQSYQLYGQLSHCSHIQTIQSQHLLEHLFHKSTGQVMHVSPGSITQFPQLGFIGLYVVHIFVQALPLIQFFIHKSHSSYSLTRFQSQQ
ncbi:hypothetical protein IJ913_00365 [bacterium]|nr:hypothetical protein [bacterium]